MPIVHFINCKTHTAGKMKAVLGYVSKEKKTKYEDRRFVSGVNCSPQTAYEEMKNTKQRTVTLQLLTSKDFWAMKHLKRLS